MLIDIDWTDMDTRVVTAHLPLDLAEKVDRKSEELDRPRGWIVRRTSSSKSSLGDVGRRCKKIVNPGIRRRREVEEARLPRGASTAGRGG